MTVQVGDLNFTGEMDPFATPSWEQSLVDGGFYTEEGGAVLGDTTTAPVSDPLPYTQAQVDNFNTQQDNIVSGAADTAASQGVGLGFDIRNYLSAYNKQQSGIDTQLINNAMAKRQGTRDIRDMVGRGIRSGATMLSNRNAADSSAAGALARAYGNIGNREMGKVNNQYQTGLSEAQTLQEQFNTDQQIGFDQLKADKDQIVTDIVNAAKAEITALDGLMINAGITDRIAIQQEIDAIREAAVTELAQYDVTKGNTAMNSNQVQTKANENLQAGIGADKQFNYTNQAPAQFQGTGPFAGNLPIFTNPGQAKKKEV